MAARRFFWQRRPSSRFCSARKLFEDSSNPKKLRWWHGGLNKTENLTSIYGPLVRAEAVVLCFLECRFSYAFPRFFFFCCAPEKCFLYLWFLRFSFSGVAFSPWPLCGPHFPLKPSPSPVAPGGRMFLWEFVKPMERECHSTLVWKEVKGKTGCRSFPFFFLSFVFRCFFSFFFSWC